MVVSIFERLIYPPPPSIFVNAMSLISLVSLAFCGLNEVAGNHLQYSKFWNVNSQKSAGKKQIKLSSVTGMLILYTPAFLAGVLSFFFFPNEDLRFLLLKTTVALHFFKRDFEVVFIHKYSGGMILDSVILISLSYTMASVTLIYAQHLTRGLPDLPIDLKYPGIVLFVIGIAGNFYHHYLLSQLRGKGDTEYRIPKGGLFGLVICPHYLFEIIAFIGVLFISQTLYAFSFTIACIFYLLGRSYATRRWYLSKFEDFPKEIKALVPCIF